MKQVVELQDGEHFFHTYDRTIINKVLRQVCVGGGETGILDYVETQEVATCIDGKITLITGRRAEKCNPYAPVIVCTMTATLD